MFSLFLPPSSLPPLSLLSPSLLLSPFSSLPSPPPNSFCQGILDNDQLAAELAIALKADLLILLSDVEGVYSGPPSEAGSRLLRTYLTSNNNNNNNYIGGRGGSGQSIQFWSKSSLGRGGMQSKVRY